MPIKCQTIIDKIERLAPKRIAEEWDNVGLQIGDPRAEIEKVLISLDLTEEVVEEAIGLNANLIITHHPFIFKPLKNIRTDLSTGKLIEKMIKNNINLYTAHTNLDMAKDGLNKMLSDKLGLKNVNVLLPTDKEIFYKIAVFVPKGFENKIRNAIGDVGAGWIGNYSHCTFTTMGMGTFKPLEDSNPFIGDKGKLEQVEEYRIETIVTEDNLSKTIRAIVKVHPYEEVAYDIYPLINEGNSYGLGRIGNLDKNLSYIDFIKEIKQSLNISYLRVGGIKKECISKVALSTGSGADLIYRAAILGADAYITGDIKYHDAQLAKDLDILLVDASHFATEIIVMEELKKYLDKEISKSKKGIEIITSKLNKDFIEWN